VSHIRIAAVSDQPLGSIRGNVEADVESLTIEQGARSFRASRAARMTPCRASVLPTQWCPWN